MCSDSASVFSVSSTQTFAKGRNFFDKVLQRSSAASSSSPQVILSPEEIARLPARHRHQHVKAYYTHKAAMSVAPPSYLKASAAMPSPPPYDLPKDKASDKA
ncbi:hypothetical protein Rhopal_002376-T1 [Rhodotorula paludigena]|uniref:Uncharacterized protein n=1 Tax=Rhodotorula paludigena TaxID=86838 RepID=A0AAV5GIU9_9BASI|nr:hypothetical protein Rhopal_002376-T1 [Rhodotorula paludigena]